MYRVTWSDTRPNVKTAITELLTLHFFTLINRSLVTLLVSYRKIPKISPGTSIFQRPFLRGLYLEGLIYYGGKFAFQNRLG